MLERSVVISPRQLLAFAAGVGEVAAVHFDDADDPDRANDAAAGAASLGDSSGGWVGVPAFCVSLEWPVVRASTSENPLGASAAEVLRGVHASQDSTFHRPISAGDRLRVTGQIASIRATRAGALVSNKLVTADAATGEPVVTSWYVSIFRGVAVEGESEPIELPPPPPTFEASGLAMTGSTTSGPDAPPTRVSIPIARQAPHIYTECADIWNPIHTERKVALAAGLPDIILHGTATWALAAREIVRHRCGGDPLRLRRLHGRFAAMVVPGSSIEVEIGGEPGAELGFAAGSQCAIPFAVRNAAGELVVAQGFAELA